MTRSFIVTLMLLMLFTTVNAQKNKRLWHFYGGPSLGAMYYVGELKRNSLPEEEYLHPSIGLRGSLQYKSIVSFQLSYTYGALSGYDSLVNTVLENRAFQFQTQTHDVEFFTKLTLLNHNKRITRANPIVFHPKLIAGVGFMNFNPYVWYDGEKVFLRDLGTEGQTLGLEGYDDPYSKWALGFKLGVELSFQSGPRTFIDFYGYYTFAQTDYLDDVGGGNYIEHSDLAAAENPSLLKRYAYAKAHQDFNRTPSHSRGNPETNDGYFNFGVAISYRFTEIGKSNGVITIPFMDRVRF